MFGTHIYELHPEEVAAYQCCLMTLSVESAMKGDNIVCLLIWLLHSQERINVSAVPRAPQVFSQPLSWHLAYTGLSKQCKQCEQQDNWCHKQDQ